MAKFELKGVNGQLSVYENKVEISRKGALGFLTQGLSGTKTIPIKNIVAVQVKPAGFWTNGYIQFIMSGHVESSRGALKATKDENTVFFKSKHNHLVQQIKNHVESIIL